MTIQERMNTINGDGKHDYTFQEAANKFLKGLGTHNSVDYSGIALTRYTPAECFNIIFKSAVGRFTVQEVLNQMASNSGKHDQTAREALNSIETEANLKNGIP